MHKSQGLRTNQRLAMWLEKEESIKQIFTWMLVCLCYVYNQWNLLDCVKNY